MWAYGRLTADPEGGATSQGSMFSRFTLAVKVGWDKIAQKEKTQFYRCTAWGNLADRLQQHVFKGDKLFITGVHTTEEYEKDGVKQYSHKVIVNDFDILQRAKINLTRGDIDTSKAEAKHITPGNPSSYVQEPKLDASEEDIPY
jgi:single-strand DNA-binding protein